MSDSSLVSVRLPQELRARLEAQAEQRSLKLAAVIRVLVDARLRELEADEQLTRAEAWQRAQVCGTWERHLSGGGEESSWDEVERLFEALPRAPNRSAPKP